jgi:inosose dehydratase
MIRVGNAPTSWGIEKPSDPTYPLWSTVLDEIATAGYDGLELGPLGFLPDDPQTLGTELAKRQLQLSAGNVMTRLDDPATTSEILQRATATCELGGALGASYFVIIDGIVPDREGSAGRRDEASRLEGAPWRTLIDTVSRLAELAASLGLVAAYHPHAGTRVEFRDEIERLLDETDPALVRLCVDVGHSMFAGIDPAELLRTHADRLAYVHLKDVDDGVLERARRERLGFWDAYGLGVFCVLGQGCIDFAGVRDSLFAIGYDGWMTVEQDASPTGGSVPLEDAEASLEFLRKMGMVGAGPHD